VPLYCSAISYICRIGPLGEGLLRVWPVTRSVTRLLTSDVSVVPLRLRRNAELRFVGHVATGRDAWDAVAWSKPSGRTWDLADGSRKCHPPISEVSHPSSCRREDRGRKPILVWDFQVRVRRVEVVRHSHPTAAGQSRTIRPRGLATFGEEYCTADHR